MTAFASLLRRDLVLAYRQGIDAIVVVLFFLAAGILFPFAIGSAPEKLAPLAPAVVLVMAALASLMSLDKLFQADLEDGSLDQLLLCPLPLELAVLTKVLSHWLSASLPLIVCAPLLALMLHLSVGAIADLMMALLLATPALSLLGTLGAALTLGARRSGLLLAFLVLPLFLPVLIFAAAASDPSFTASAKEIVPLTILGALDFGLTAIVPWAGAAAIRAAVRS